MNRSTLAAGIVAVVIFMATIPLANWTLDTYGFIDVPWLGLIPAGTAWIAAAFVARDVAQACIGKWPVLVAIVVGAGLSALLAEPALAWASFAAFACSELLDMAVYTPLADRGRFGLGVLLSSVVGGALDSWLFLQVAFGSEVASDGWWRLAIAKAVIVLAVTPLAILGRRAVSRHAAAT